MLSSAPQSPTPSGRGVVKMDYQSEGGGWDVAGARRAVKAARRLRRAFIREGTDFVALGIHLNLDQLKKLYRARHPKTAKSG